MREPLRVAQEYEAMFGRARLDEAIRSALPDMEHRPSDLHRRLLTLPWADVFTTNWDTLLERACPEAHERAYDVVATPSQLPSASVPRIVKLHGTLPANGPFIMTEEDFRTYPQQFAPFVNSVQQAMMETSMVLLGFSGDDPNFLQWSGWARDHLGVHAPQIYLVGWLGLAPQRHRMLQERMVVPIDLSELPGARDWPEEVRQGRAMEWFLHAMEGGRPARLMRWPEHGPEPVTAAPHLGWTMPARAAASSFDLWPRAGIGAADTIAVEEFRSLIAAWREERRGRPPWWVVPHAVRNRLWSRCEHWLPDAAKRIAPLPMPERLLSLGETLRRLDMCLLDAEVVRDLPALLDAVLAAVDPDGRTWSSDGTSGAMDPTAREEWRFCLLASARLARAACDGVAHGSRLAALDQAAHGHPEVAHEVAFERALMHRHMLADDELDAFLNDWDTRGADAVWNIRKAGLLAGLGRSREAKPLVVDAIVQARRNRRSEGPDLAALSREGWGLVLGVAWHRNILDGTVNGLTDAGDRDPWGRWEDLRPYGCDGWSDIADLAAAMREPPPPPQQQRVRAFEPGSISVTFNFNAGLPDAYRTGRQMARLADMTGLPPVANNVIILRKSLEKAIEACAADDPAPLILLLARVSEAGSDKALHRYLTRARVATLGDGDVAMLVEALARRAAGARDRATGGSHAEDFWTARFRVAVEMLSRLMPRCSDQQAAAGFALACHLVQSGWSVTDRHAGQEIERLFRRAIARLEAQELPAAALMMAGLRFPDPARSVPGRGLADPMLGLEARMPVLRDEFARAAVVAEHRLVEALVEEGRRSAASRKIAVERLYALHRAGALPPGGEAHLADLIWTDHNPGASGIPEGLGFHPWAYLLMPERHPGQAAAAFRRAFLRGKDGRPLGDALWNVGHALDATRRHGVPFLFDEDDFAAASGLAIAWARRPAPEQKRFTVIGADEEEAAQDGLSRLLVAARLPDEVMAAIRDKVEALQNEPGGGPSGLGLLPGLVLVVPGLGTVAAGWIRRALVSADTSVVGQAVRAMYGWLDADRRNPGMVGPPDDLVEEIGGIVAARRSQSIAPALDLARWIFDEGTARLRPLIAARCDLALDYLIDETAYANEVRAGHETDLDAPLLRQRAMALAGAMHRAGHGNGRGVERWIVEGPQDPLAEVRRAGGREIEE